MSKIDDLIKSLQIAKELLAKRAPKGVDPDKHEKCVMDVKAQGHDVGSAHAICTSSMKKEDRKEEDDYGADLETKNFLEHFNPATKHPKDPTAGMPESKKPGERTTPTGFKIKVAKNEECLKFSKSGQWSLDKSNEIKPIIANEKVNTYDSKANINRKATRTGEERPEMGRNQGVRQYTTSGSSMSQAHEITAAKEQKAKTKASTRTFADMSEEEKAEMKAKYKQPLAKGADVSKEALTTGTLPVLQDAGKQPTDEQMFGHLVKTEEQVKAENTHWENGVKRSMVEASKPIDQLNKSTVKATWSYGKSFNSLLKDELSEKEIAERNSCIEE